MRFMLAIGWYEVVKFFHDVLAIVAVGFNATFGIWLARAASEHQHEAFTLRGVKVLDDRFANPAYVLLLVTGLLMVWIGDLDLTQFWILIAVIPGAPRLHADDPGPDRRSRDSRSGLARVPCALQARNHRRSHARST